MLRLDGCRQSHWIQQSGLSIRAGNDIARSGVGINGDSLLVRIERPHELSREVFLASEHTQPGAWARFDFGRMRSHERRRDRDGGTIENREIQRQMMSLPAPSPGFFSAWRAEDADEISLRIAHRPSFALLYIRQYLFQAHDRRCLHITALAQGRV